jgi:hypothetical protein
MAASEESLGAVAAQLARRWANQRLTAVQGYGRILAEYGQGRSTGGAALSAFAKLAVEEAARYPVDAIGIATDYAAAVARRTGLELETAKHEAKARSAPVVRDLDICGPQGGEALGEFFMTNPYDAAVALSFATSTFMGPQGEIPVGVRLVPADLLLAGGQEQKITVAVPLDDPAFEAGAAYTAHVAIGGFDHMVLRVRLTVLDPS